MSTMAERLALVLSEKGYEIDEDMFHYTPEERPHSYNALVRAILEAMMEPTEAMVLSQGKSKPENARTETQRQRAEDLNRSVRQMALIQWREMIQAALKESA